MTNSIKTTAVFLRPFQLPGFNETLPAGEYQVESQLLDPVDSAEAGEWTSSVHVRLHSRATHPGLSRTLTVPLVELQNAVARDKLTGRALADFFLEEMLVDPMIRLVMQADGVSEAEMRDLHGERHVERPGKEGNGKDTGATIAGDDAGDLGPHRGSARPGIGE